MPKPKHVNALDVLNIGDVIDKIALDTGYFKKDVKKILTKFREVVLDEVAHGNAVRWSGFGIFLPVIRHYRQKTPDGAVKYKVSKSDMGLVFYPSATCAKMKPKVDVDLLLARGDYDGPSHKYAL